MQLTGLLPLNKPYGMRSTQCVELARRILGRKIKVGHGGTLDSTASGLLVLLVGGATRLSSFVMEMPKCYETTVQLGCETTTDDASGEPIGTAADWHGVTAQCLDSALVGFMGWRMQAPPKISAVHVNGERAHRLARDGMEVELAEKPVYFADIKRISGISEDGMVTFNVHCRKGTYIRSFARDLGRKLSCGAHVHILKRLSIGPFKLENCKRADDLFNMKREDLVREILPVSSLCVSSPCYLPDLSQSKRLSNGLSLQLKDLRRMNFGRHAMAFEHVLLSSDELFSICGYSLAGGSLELVPAVNIIYDRSI